jgi:hypothetical protein
VINIQAQETAFHAEAKEHEAAAGTHYWVLQSVPATEAFLAADASCQAAKRAGIEVSIDGCYCTVAGETAHLTLKLAYCRMALPEATLQPTPARPT